MASSKRVKRVKTLTAEVVMKPRGGIRAEEITSANVHEITPDAATMQHAAQWFREHGFTIAAAGPLSFSITAPASTFEEVFAMRGKTLKRPKEMPDEVEEVTFPPPPDFGPTSFH